MAAHSPIEVFDSFFGKVYRAQRQKNWEVNLTNAEIEFIFFTFIFILIMCFVPHVLLCFAQLDYKLL